MFDARRVLPAEVRRQRSGLRHRVEGRVRDHAKEVIAYQEQLAAGLLHPPDRMAVLRCEVASQGVDRLVIVLVGVAEPEVEVGHGCLPLIDSTWLTSRRI